MGNVSLVAVDVMTLLGAVVDPTDDDLNLQLMVAAHQGNIQSLTKILDNGIDINSQDLMFFETPLISASRYGHINIAQFLIDRGANINIQSKIGQSALHVAVMNAQIHCTDFLLKCEGILKNLQDDLGMTPLMVAAHRGLHREVKVLIEHSCCVDSANAHGQAAIHLTQLSYRGPVGNFDGFLCLKELTSCGMDIDARDADGMTPLHYAIKDGSYFSVKWLVSENCDINAVAKCINLRGLASHDNIPLPTTPLSLAVYFYNLRVVKLLLESGCDKKGYTNILSYAKKHTGIHSLLLDAFQNAETLKLISRRTIRKAIGRDVQTKVKTLLLPEFLKDYLYEL